MVDGTFSDRMRDTRKPITREGNGADRGSHDVNSGRRRERRHSGDRDAWMRIRNVDGGDRLEPRQLGTGSRPCPDTCQNQGATTCTPDADWEERQRIGRMDTDVDLGRAVHPETRADPRRRRRARPGRPTQLAGRGGRWS